MKSNTWTALLLSAACACAPAARATPSSPQAQPADVARFDHRHAAWTEVLAERVRGESFDYEGLKAAPAPLDRYLA